MSAMNPGPVYIVGGSYGDFDRWCKRTGMREPWVRYLSEADQLRGLENVLIVVVDGGWARLHAPGRFGDALNMLQGRGQARIETAATEPSTR